MRVKQNISEGEKHFCASVWIITDSSPKKILLVLHKKLGRWLQPGGHIESFENPVEAAIREVEEETGINISSLAKQIEVIDSDGSFLPVPEFIMEQTIPQYNGQPQHFHLDIQYVVRIPEQKITHSAAESHDIGWFTKEEAEKLPIHEDTRVVIQKLM